MSNLVGAVRNWIEAPFVGSVSPARLFALVGLVMVAIVLWEIILYHVRAAAMETL